MGSKIVNYYCTGSTYTVIRATKDSYSVMQMNTKGSGHVWVNTRQADFTGDFTVKVQPLVGEGHSNSAVDVRFLSIEKGRTSTGNPNNLIFRISKITGKLTANITVNASGIGGMVTASAGFKVESIKVNGVAIEGDTFAMTEKDAHVEATYVSDVNPSAKPTAKQAYLVELCKRMVIYGEAARICFGG